jgi:hypothetical protein
MADEVATEVLKEVEREKADRGNFDALWDQVRRRVLPRHEHFQQGSPSTPGERRTQYQFTSRPAIVLDRWVAVMLSLIMPQSEFYHGVRPVERSIRKNTDIKRWCEETRDDMFQMRYSTRSAFVPQINEVLLSAGAFGTGVMFIDDRPGRPTSYKALSMDRTWLRETEEGKLGWAYRQLNLKPYQAVAQFGADKLPEQIVKAVQTNPGQDFVFYHRVKPRDFINKRMRFGPESMAWQSDYVCEVDKKHLETGGYRVFPMPAMRVTTNANEVYGRGPAITALADIKMMNEVNRTILRSSHRMAEPTMLLADDAALMPFQMQPGFRNKGYLKSTDGTPLAQQLKWEGDLNPALLVNERINSDMDEAFGQQIFNLLMSNPQMTATEILQRVRERAMLLTPSAGRMHNEFVGAMGERELDILTARGKLAPPPELLERVGNEVEITDTSPLARSLRAAAAEGFDRTLQQVLPLAEQDPTLIRRFKMDEILPELSEIHGMPLSWLYSNDEFAQLMERQRQEQQAQQAVMAAPELASAAKDAAQARLFTQQSAGNV